MKWLVIYLVVTAIILMFNHGAHMHDYLDDEFYSDKLSIK